MTFLRARRALLVPATAVALLSSGAGIGWAVGFADPAPVVVVREPLAQAEAPRGAPGRTLGLSRVTVMPGAELASHHHPGTQIARIANGTLTYSVETGAVKVMSGSSDDPTVVRRITAGHTGRIRTGQWIVEQPDEVHHAANRGTEPVVIYLATLFTTGAPPSLPN
ncbi:MAG: Cupin 2, conserved barrel domain protein [Nocardioides sp.]|nr:Cupin 2, conserved barrel domain protein [Nocardioides sp.]